MARIHAGIALVSAASLLLQIILTRIFSVVQWYHFAFMAVGLGLLGYGASGTALAVVPALGRAHVRTAAWSAVLLLPAAGLALLAIAAVPFDAYLIALEPVQLIYLTAQVTVLVLPFFCAGLAVGAVLTGFPEAAASLYAASFMGAGAGALAAVVLLGALTGPGAMVAAAAVAVAGAALLWWDVRRAAAVAAAVVAVLTALAATLPLDLPLSPYKALSQLRRYPNARIEFSRWNAISKVDVVHSRAIRSAPGLSYTFPGIPPSLPGLTIDGEGVRGLPASVDAAFTDYLPTSVAYRLAPGRALIVGMSVEVLGALWHRMQRVTVLESNPLVIEAARSFAPDVVERPPTPPVVRAVVENPRTYLRRARNRFDVIQVPPQESFQVVASGTFSLTEHYLYTVEAFRDYLRRLAPGGVLAVTRWIQTPPSEEIRTWAAAVIAVNGAGDRLIALRSLNTITILIKPEGFSPADVAAVRAFAAARKFDITYAPGVDAREGNQYNVMPTDVHREAFVAILDPVRRRAFLQAYPFDVTPVRDDRPFFFHFFKWRQVPKIVASLGRTWQPFGGGGYLVLLALLMIVAVLSAGLILAPLRSLSRRSMQTSRPVQHRGTVFVYFLALGVAYLFVEIPLLQQMILVLGQPTYALAAVLFCLLIASGIGSLLSPRLARRLLRAVIILAAAAAGIAWGLPRVVDVSLGFSTVGRVATLAALVLPLGVLMGIPFPVAIRILGRTDPSLIPWAWGINGCASVLGSIAAALLALLWGFRAVMLLGALAYAGAGAAGVAAWLHETRRDGGVPAQEVN